MPFYQQKEKECEWLEKGINGGCATTVKNVTGKTGGVKAAISLNSSKVSASKFNKF